MLAMNLQAAVKRTSKQRPKLEYFFGDAARERLDNARQEIIGNPVASVLLTTSSGLWHDHVATASDIATGRTIGVVAASRLVSTREPFLCLEQVVLDHSYNPHVLLRRLVAMLLLRVAGVDGMPAALALRAPVEWPAEVFLSLADHFTGSVRYPPPDRTPVGLATAQLAKRIAQVVAGVRYNLATSRLCGARIASNRNGSASDAYGTSTAIDFTANHPLTAYDEMLLLIDLRAEEETVLIDDARQAYRKP